MLDGNAVRSVDRAASLLIALGKHKERQGLPSSHAASASTSRLRRGCSPRSRSGPGGAGRRLGQVPTGTGRRSTRWSCREVARSSVDRDVGARVAGSIDPRDDDPRGPRGRQRPHHRLFGRLRDGRDRTGATHRCTRRLPARSPGQPAGARSDRLSKIGFTPYTSHTIVRVDLLLEELARVRKRGFATAFGEHEARQRRRRAGLRPARVCRGGPRGSRLRQPDHAQPRARARGSGSRGCGRDHGPNRRVVASI